MQRFFASHIDQGFHCHFPTRVLERPVVKQQRIRKKYMSRFGHGTHYFNYKDRFALTKRKKKCFYERVPMADWSNVLRCLFTDSNVRGSIPQWRNEGRRAIGADAPATLWGGRHFRPSVSW